MVEIVFGARARVFVRLREVVVLEEHGEGVGGGDWGEHWVRSFSALVVRWGLGVVGRENRGLLPGKVLWVRVL